MILGKKGGYFRLGILAPRDGQKIPEISYMVMFPNPGSAVAQW